MKAYLTFKDGLEIEGRLRVASKWKEHSGYWEFHATGKFKGHISRMVTSTKDEILEDFKRFGRIKENQDG